MADIGAELLEQIRAYFKKKCQGDEYIQSVLGKVAAGTAQMEEISLLSQSIGFRASQAISEYVNVAALPDGKMYYNIADTILTGVLKDNYEIINSAAAECQQALDRKMGINIEPQRAPYPAERVQAVAGAASAPDISEEKMVRRMTSTVENITQSFSDDYVEANAKFRSEAGLECYIIRISHNTMGSCCKWCGSLEGKYLYPDDVPKDVYRRHDRCHCTVTYVNNRRGQNVWQQRLGFRKLTDTETEFIKQTGFKKPWMVDYNIGSGIIKSGFKTPHISAEERERMKQIGFKKPTISAEEREQMKIMGFKKPTVSAEKRERVKVDGLGNIGVGKTKIDLTQRDYDDIIDMKGKMSDVDVRKWYISHSKNIPNLIDKSKSVEEQARQACELRNQYRFQARELMKDQEARKVLDQTDPIISFEELVSGKMVQKNLSREEAVKDTLETAVKTRKSVNKKFGLED